MKNELAAQQNIQSKILTFREQQVMIDLDLAELYGVETKVLNQAVKRNIERFPEDFMFQLSNEEFSVLRSQIVTSKLRLEAEDNIFLMFLQSRVLLCFHRF